MDKSPWEKAKAGSKAADDILRDAGKRIGKKARRADKKARKIYTGK